MLYLYDSLIGLRLVLRARYVWLVGCSLLVLVMAVVLAALFSGRQPATVALDVGLSVIRLLLPLVLVLLIQELLSREFDRRYFLNSLTYPRPRHSLLLGRFLLVVGLALGQLLIMSLILALLVGLISNGYKQGTPVALDHYYLIVVGFIGVDVVVLASLATLLAVVASTHSFVLIGTFGFMLVARSYGSIVELLGNNSELVYGFEGYRTSLGALGYLLPDLGALDVRMLALYGKAEFLPADWPLLLLSSLGYAMALLTLAVWALQRKRFN